MRRHAVHLLAPVFGLIFSEQAAANEIMFQLQMTVPVMCSIRDVRPVDLHTGVLEVDASCNAEAFQLVLGGDLGAITPESISVSNAAAQNLGSNVIAVHSERPGFFVFQLKYGQDLANIRSASAYIQAT